MRIMLVLAKDNIYRFDSLHQRKYYPQITLITLESLIDKKYNAEIVLVDEGVEEYDATSSKYSDEKFDLICISAVISASRRAKEISKFWKDKGAYTQIGGHYATVLSDEALEYFDTVIKGPAEIAFPAFIKDFVEGKPKREYFELVGNDFEYKPLNRKLLTNKKYYKSFGTIVANNGCPNKCTYCSVTKMYSGKNQLKNIDFVVSEIKSNKHKKWVFYDPNFLADKSYAINLMNELKKLKIKWTASATINIGNDINMLQLMKEAGCIGLVIGLESFIQENLNGVNKGFNNVKEYKRLVSTIQSYGISVLSTLMIGMETENRLLTTDWYYYDTETVVFQPKNMSPATLQEEFYKLWQDTFTYKRIFKRLKTSKNKGLKLILEIFSRQHAKKFKKYTKLDFIN